MLDGLPTSTKRIDTLVTLTPGFTGVADVGGRYFSEPGAYHGKRGTKQYFDGMGIENSAGNSSYQVNAAVVEEMVLNTSGMSAETNSDGPVMNVIPKEGGNTFKFIGSGLWTNDKLESDNLDDDLRARGLSEPQSHQQDLRQRGEPGRADQEGQDLVLRRGAHLGHGPAIRRPVLEQGTEHAALAPRRRPRGREVRPVDRPAVRRAQRPVGMVRLVPRPGDLGGDAEAQDELPVRPPARVQLRRHHVEHPERSGQRLPVRAEQVHAAHLQLADHQQAAARSRRRRLDLSVERLLADRHDGQDGEHHRRGSRQDLRRGRDLSRPSGLHQPLHAARGAHLRHRHAHGEGRVHLRAHAHRQLLHRQRQRQLHVPERHADLDPPAHHAVSGTGPDRRARHVHPGSVAPQPVHVQLRPPVRLRQRLHPGAGDAGHP